MFSILIASLIASMAPQAMANLYLTAPVASTTCTAGQQCSTAWNDDGKAPSLSSFGVCLVGLYVGSPTQQVLIQDLGSVDVSQQANANFVPTATIGPNGNMYFIRFTSLNFKDPSNPQYAAQGFSAKFTLAGMNGQFNSTIQGLIDGSAGVGTGNPSSAGPAATNAGTASSPSTSSAAPSGTAKTSSPARAQSPSSSASPTAGAAFARFDLNGSNMLVAAATVLVSAVAAGLAI